MKEFSILEKFENPDMDYLAIMRGVRKVIKDTIKVDGNYTISSYKGEKDDLYEVISIRADLYGSVIGLEHSISRSALADYNYVELLAFFENICHEFNIMYRSEKEKYEKKIRVEIDDYDFLKETYPYYRSLLSDHYKTWLMSKLKKAGIPIVGLYNVKNGTMTIWRSVENPHATIFEWKGESTQ